MVIIIIIPQFTYVMAYSVCSGKLNFAPKERRHGLCFIILILIILSPTIRLRLIIVIYDAIT